MENELFVSTKSVNIQRIRDIFKNVTIKEIPKELEYIEPTTLYGLGIATHQNVIYAHNILNAPCLITYFSLYIDELHGFPDVNVAKVLEKLGVDRLLELMNDIKDRNCKITKTIAFANNTQTLFFEDTMKGTISLEPEGIFNVKNFYVPFSIQKIFIPEGSNRTLAQLNFSEHEKYINNDYRKIIKYIMNYYLLHNLY